MSQASKIVEKAAQAAGTKTALAKELDVSITRMSDWIHGRATVPDAVLAYCAQKIGDEPIDALARTKGGVWETVAKAAAGAALSVFLVGAPPSANASPATQFSTGGLYIMSNRRRWNPQPLGIPVLV